MLDLAVSEEGPKGAGQWIRQIPDVTAPMLASADLSDLYEMGDSAPGSRLLAAARTAPAAAVANVAASVATRVGDLEAAMELMDTLDARGEEVGYLPSYRAMILAGTGRRDSALLHLPAIAPDARSIMSAYIAAAPFTPMDGWEMETTRRSLEQQAVDSVWSEPLTPLYLIALLDVRAGRDSAALAIADTLESASTSMPAERRSAVEVWARSIRATAALRRDDVEAALAALGAIDGPIPLAHANNTVLDRTRERYLLGTLLIEAGRPDEAVPWLTHGITGAFSTLLYQPMSQLRLGEAHEMAGRDTEAVQHYARFLRYFAHAEPAMQPYVMLARDGLGRLTAEGLR